LIRKKFKDIIFALGCEQIYEAADGQQAIEMYKEQNQI